MSVQDGYRVICTDYLRTLADLIEAGAVTAFKLDWGKDLAKPVGNFVMTSSFLVTDSEIEIQDQIDEHHASQANKIEVQDLTKNQPPTDKGNN